MPLKPKISGEWEEIRVLKSKHARYIDGACVVDVGEVAADFCPAGTVFGKIDDSGKYAPVTRDYVDTDGANTSTGVIPLKNLTADGWHNWQLGDEVIIDPDDTAETATITGINEADGELTVDEITTAHAEDVVIQKNDGTGTAEFVATGLVDLSEGEDALTGGITHGAVYKAMVPNYDEIVAADLNMVAFE